MKEYSEDGIPELEQFELDDVACAFPDIEDFKNSLEEQDYGL